LPSGTGSSFQEHMQISEAALGLRPSKSLLISRRVRTGTLLEDAPHTRAPSLTFQKFIGFGVSELCDSHHPLSI
jgi:hypothetical protein